MPNEERIVNSSGTATVAKAPTHDRTKTEVSSGSVTEAGGVCKITFNIMEELHGDNSLEPGEVITPPHGNTAAISKENAIMENTKRMLKEAMCKTIKKSSSQIDKNIEPKELSLLRAGAGVGAVVSKVSGADFAVKNFKETKLKESGVIDDDSEGLYSGSDSSSDHQKINKPRPYEMHPKLTISQSSADSFVNSPPYKNFMPRLPHFMPRGNMRPNFYRAPFSHGHPRPYGPPIGGPPRHNMPRQQHTPPPSRGHSPIRAPKSGGGRQTSPPGSGNRGQRPTSDSVNSRNTVSKDKLLWTCSSKPPISWSLGAKQRNRIEDLYRDYSEALSKRNNKSEDTPNVKRIEKSKTERNSTKRAENVEKVENKKSQDKNKSESKSKREEERMLKHHKEQKVVKLTEEKSTKDSNEMFDIFADSPPSILSKSVTDCESKQKMINPLNIKKEKMDSPDNKNKQNDFPKAPNISKPDKRSHTPPPPPVSSSKPNEKSLLSTTTPSVSIDSSQEKNKRETTIDVQNRIGKLLEDNDLQFQIDELLANKEKFLRKTREHKNRENHLKGQKNNKQTNKERRYTPEIDVKRLEVGVRIKIEPPDDSTNEISSNSSRKDGYVPIREIKRETSPWEDEEEYSNIRTPSPLPIHKKQSHSSKWDVKELSTTSMKRSSMSSAAAATSSSPPSPLKNTTAFKKHENPFKQTVLHDDHNLYVVGRMPKSNEREREHDRTDRSSERNHFKPMSTTCSIKLKIGYDTKSQESNYSKSKKSQWPQSFTVKSFKPLSYTVDDVESNSDSSSKSTNGSKTQISPDTDDYIDNWENDDSTIACDATTANIFNAIDDDDSIISNHLWNTNSTPPPKTATTIITPIKSTTPISTPPKKTDKKIDIDMQIMYDKFLKSIKMNASESEGNNDESIVATPKSVHSKSPSSESSDSSTETSLEESSSQEEEEEEEDNENVKMEEEENVKPELFERAAQTESIEENFETLMKKPHENEIQTKNSVSKDLKRLKTLEGNLARIQMMRENYDSGDELCEELVKMESLFLVEKNAIMEKYKKNDLKLNANRKQQDTLKAMKEKMLNVSNSLPKPEIVPNKIFDVNREAIKLTISPKKLKRKSAIFEKEETELNVSQPLQKDAIERLAKPPKEIAIVKPIMDTKRNKRLSSPPAYKSRSQRCRRSRSLSRSRRNSSSPRRRRPESTGRCRNRFRSGGIVSKRSHSRSFSPKRSVSRSRSRSRHRHLKDRRKRHSYSPLPPSKSGGPRSPPLPAYRRSYSRERYSRSPLPFKPPSPPMRRSYSSSLSPTTRSTSPSYEHFSTYYSSDRRSEDSSNYYYNISPNDAAMPLSRRIDVLNSGQTNDQSNDGIYGNTYDTIAPYSDMASYGNEYDSYYLSQYNSQLYSSSSNVSMQGDIDLQHEMGYYYNEYGQPLVIEGMGANASLLKELPKAPAVAVQKGNVLEIVPSGDLPPIIAASSETTVPAVVAEQTDEENAAKLEAKQKRKEARLLKKIERKKAAALAAEESAQPGKKKVNFEDRVAVNRGSDDEDDKVIRHAIKGILKKTQTSNKNPESRRTRLIARVFGKRSLPPPPPVTATTKRVQPIYLLKKPVMRYYHWNQDACTIYSSYNPMPKSTRNRKCVPLPYNVVKFGAGVVDTNTNDDVTRKSINSKYLQPPPPLGQPINNEIDQDMASLVTPTTLPPPPIGDFIRSSQHFLMTPPPIPSLQSQSQPIPVLALGYNIPVVAPSSSTLPTHVYPVHIPAPVDQTPQLTYISTSNAPINYLHEINPKIDTAPKGLLPTPSIQPVFNVTPVPTITEIKREESPIAPEYELHTPMHSYDKPMVDTIKMEETGDINDDDHKTSMPTMMTAKLESLKNLPSDLSETKLNPSLTLPVSPVET